ncbi:MAG: hypothetical protein QG656_67 [Candidatus Hydrogenedentes bacterium]|nr:hypothetical protein [Candidatus Hydrogenedentota bacterium]
MPQAGMILSITKYIFDNRVISIPIGPEHLDRFRKPVPGGLTTEFYPQPDHSVK